MAVIQATPIHERTTSFKDWLDLYESCEILENCVADELRPVFTAISRNFNHNEWQRAKEFRPKLLARAQQDTGLMNALNDLLAKRLLRVRDDAQTHWQLVAEQLSTSAQIAKPTEVSIQFAWARVSDVASMSRTNTWFHSKIQPFLPQLARYMLIHSYWFTAKRSMGTHAVIRWTQLPLRNFVQWMKAGHDVPPQSTEEDHLKLLLSAICAGTQQHHLKASLDLLWKTFCSPPDQLRPPYDQMPTLLAQLATGLPFSSKIALDVTDATIVGWLQETFKDSRFAESVQLELDIGTAVMQLNHAGSSAARNPYLACPPDEQVSKGIAGIAHVLHGHQASSQTPTDQQLSDALDHLLEISKKSALSGSLRKCIQILQTLASEDRLTKSQVKLLDACLREDLARRTRQAAALV